MWIFVYHNVGNEVQLQQRLQLPSGTLYIRFIWIVNKILIRKQSMKTILCVDQVNQMGCDLCNKTVID